MKTLKVALPLLLVIALVGTACAAPAAEQEETAPAAEEQIIEEAPAEEEPAAEAQTGEETQTEDVQEAEEPSEEEEEEEEEEIVQSAVDGAEIYASNCAGCHAPDRSGRNGPPLLPANLTSDPSSYVQLITDGLGGMPSFGNRLSADEINAVVDFILSEPE